MNTPAHVIFAAAAFARPFDRRRTVAAVAGGLGLPLVYNTSSYDSLDSLRLLGQRHPGSELFLLIGADNVSDISTWHDPEGILELCTVVAGSRPMATATPPDPELVSRIVFVETPAIDISSTRIRQRLRDGLPVRWLIPDGVEEYIRAERLYR